MFWAICLFSVKIPIFPTSTFPAKAELSIAAATKRATSCILVTPPKSSADYKEYYDYAVKEISKLLNY